MNQTLFDKIWHRRVVGTFGDGRARIAIDRHVVPLAEPLVRQIAETIGAADDPTMTFDLLRSQIIPPRDAVIPFAIAEERRAAIPGGMDEPDVLPERLQDRVARPFAWPHGRG